MVRPAHGRYGLLMIPHTTSIQFLEVEKAAWGTIAFVSYAHSMCPWHKPELQTHAERYLISEASWWLSCSRLSATKTHVDSNYFPFLILSTVSSLKKEVQAFLE